MAGCTPAAGGSPRFCTKRGCGAATPSRWYSRTAMRSSKSPGAASFPDSTSAVNTHFTADEIAYVVDDSEAKAVFVDASMADPASRILDANAGVDVHICVGGNLPGWRSYDDALASAGDAPPVSDGSEMLYSSGTTGRPKAVRRPLPEDGKGSWAQKGLEYSLTQRYGMTESSGYLSPAPLYHAAGGNYTVAVDRSGSAPDRVARVH